jgi:hypothetical protein
MSQQSTKNQVTVHSAIEAKNDTEKLINEILDRFTSQTGLTVDAIDLGRVDFYGGGCRYVTKVSVVL